MEYEIWPEAESFSADGGNIGVLVQHGFTGCVQSMKPLAEHLAAEGFTVRAPRLPGHGTHWKDMGTRTWQEWLGTSEKTLKELFDKCDKVFITGLSMGGTITLNLGAKYAGRVAGLMPINAAVFLNPVLMSVVPYAKHILKSIPGIGSDIKDPSCTERAYDKVPLAAVDQLRMIMKLTKAELPKVTAPILIFSSTQDHAVPPKNSRYILEHVGSRDKELVKLENSYHVATLDFDKELIFRREVEFIRAHS
ncbi:MAG: alpha/beta hydrolase [Candidatus Geothermincolia bacterium]